MGLNINDGVERVPFVGPVQAKKLEKLEIKTVEDLLNHYPFRYDDFSQIKKINELLFGETVTVKGRIAKIQLVYTRSGRNLVRGVLTDETGEIGLVWFNQPFLTKTLKAASLVNIAGRVEQFSGKLTFISPEYEQLSTFNPPTGPLRPSEANEAGSQLSTNIHTARLVPVYPETYGLSSKWLRSRIAQVLNFEIKIVDYLPNEVKNQESLLLLKDAIKSIHFPKDANEAAAAKRRLAFDEILNLQLRASLIKREWQDKKASMRLIIDNLQLTIDKFINNLPFELTADQKKVIDEIFLDLNKNIPMNRLLQGDVGSGKTVVAALSAYATSLCGFKTIYMAPTEILAVQHHQTFQRLFQKYGVEIGLVTSSTRQNLELKIENLKFKILIGTHALLYQLKNLQKVGLVIIDEQHKFGVAQRGELLKLASPNKKSTPHLLTMTATPIPRSLALTFFGDLDLSTIYQLPKNRPKIKTWYVPKEKRSAAYEWIKKGITEGKSQAYLVCPFIEESNLESLKSVRAAKKEFEVLKKIFYPLKLDLLHGRLKDKEKEKVMQDFHEGVTDILVSTPVVEVGIDNPNATIILVEAAERFGLASLHQLRGRVGRGTKASYCLLFSETELPSTIERLKSLEKIHSGLLLAEKDLKTRGMGTLYGRDQSGFLKTKIADLNDTFFIEKVKNWTVRLLNNAKLEQDPIWQAKLKKINRADHLD